MPHPVKLAAALLVSLPLVGCAKPPQSEQAPESRPSSAVQPAQSPAGLTRIVDPSLVCMVNNRFMDSPQIPVPVNGKTYYGCCAGCKAKLANDPSARTAVDPVTQRPVDKALAVLAKTNTGAVLYFESEQNLASYSQGSRRN